MAGGADFQAKGGVDPAAADSAAAAAADPVGLAAGALEVAGLAAVALAEAAVVKEEAEIAAGEVAAVAAVNRSARAWKLPFSVRIPAAPLMPAVHLCSVRTPARSAAQQKAQAGADARRLGWIASFEPSEVAPPGELAPHRLFGAR